MIQQVYIADQLGKAICEAEEGFFVVGVEDDPGPAIRKTWRCFVSRG